ncbi:MAG: YdgA family protein [Gammaproteobacteria bacterium]|nr:YdgA family protein [Gammaproteobacteria bacterium]
MKKIVLPLIAVATVGAIAPMFVGSQIDASLNQFVTHINDSPGYSAKLTSIETTWFATTAKLDVSLQVADFSGQQGEPTAEKMSIEIDFEASHGPVLFGTHSGLGWASWSATVNGEDIRQHASWAADTPLYQLTSTMGLSGTHRYADTIPALNIIIPDIGTIDFSEYTGQGTYSGSGLVYAGGSKSIIANIDGVTVTTDSISLEIDASASFEEMVTQGIYDSTSKFHVDKVVINSLAGDDEKSFSDLYINAITGINDSKTLGNMALSYGVGVIDLKAFHAEDVALNMEFNNLSAGLFKEWQAFAKQLDTSAPQEMVLKMKDFGLDQLPAFLKPQPQFNITSLRATFPEGKVTSNLNTSLVGIDAVPDQLSDIGFWASHLLVDGKVEGDKAAIEFVASQYIKSQMLRGQSEASMTPEEIDELNTMALQQIQGMLGMLTEQGMVKATDANYTSELSFKDSQLTVNGTVIPLPIPGA